MNVNQSQQKKLSHSSSSATPSQSGGGPNGGGLSPIDDDNGHIVVTEVKLSLLVDMKENLGLVPLVDISVIDRNLME
ncbi:hypothetical protein Gotur_030470, partial [Gossypium turneri]